MKYYLIKIILYLFSFLPLNVIRLLGKLIGIIVFKYSKKTSERTKRNLLITCVANNENVEQMALNIAKNLGQTLAETFLIAWQRSPYFNYKLIKKNNNFAKVLESVELSRPIIFLTPHIANFEIIVKATSYMLKNNKFTIIVKPSKNQLFNKLMFMGRSELNIKPVPTNKRGVISLIKALKNKEIVGILPDSVASNGDGVWVNFFDQKVFATTLSAKMIQYQLADVYIVNITRVKDGFDVDFMKYDIVVDDTKYIVQDIYNILENIIKRNPEQYFWSYDRFRKPDHAPDINNI
jgi:KDO2-lipid IV(A) lauroyltransferase